MKSAGEVSTKINIFKYPGLVLTTIEVCFKTEHKNRIKVNNNNIGKNSQ